MDDFLSRLPADKRLMASLILDETPDEPTRLQLLNECLGQQYADLYNSVVTPSPLEFEEDGEEEVDVEDEVPEFVSLLQAEEKRILAAHLAANRSFSLLRSLLSKEDEEVSLAFECWFMEQPEYEAESRSPLATPKKSTASLENVLNSVSTEQRKVLINLLIKAKQWKTLDTVLLEESWETCDLFNEWKGKQQTSESAGSTPRRSKYSESDDGSESSLTNDADSDCISDGYDSDEDPTTWTPKEMEGFIDRFPECVNILILGETGVGKSTFINGLANYLKYSTMYEAKDRVEILIKSYFNNSDQDYNQRRIECEPTIQTEVSNENTDDGQSSTQAAKSYLISWGAAGRNKKIRIIDTPGVGDVRGVEQEKKNFGNILNYIAQFKEIHAICILMKPNESKLTLTFRYCINELLTHLHASASRNILFCFTNARQTLYKPGETLPTLDAHLKQLYEKRGISIPLDRSTLYCFDNESFRCLCAWREGVNFTESEKANFNLSWKTTVRETFRLFKRISELPSHKVGETISINNARRAVLSMAVPLAEISKNQIVNLQLIEEKIKEVEDCIQQGLDLRGKLHVDLVELVPQELSYPITVCTAASCVEYKKLSNRPNAPTEVVYRDPPCHVKCALDGVQTEFKPNPALKDCFRFNNPGNLCTHCPNRCSWEEHIHIRYKLDKIMQRQVDPTVEEAMAKCTDERKAAELFLENEKKRKRQIEEEAEYINKHSVELAVYLKENCLMDYNDVYKEYVDHQIKQAKAVEAEGGSSELAKKLEAHRDQYVAQIGVIEKQKSSSQPSTKTAEEVCQIIGNLKTLEKAGPILEAVSKLELIDVEKEQTVQDVNIEIKDGWIAKTVNAATSVVSSIAKGFGNVFGFGGGKKKGK